MSHLKLNYIKQLLGLLAILLGTVSCENGLFFDGDGECPNQKAEKGVTGYITVTVTTPGTMTKAETSGYEEDGQPNENEVSNLSVFFYQAASLDEAVTKNVEIMGSVYFEGEELQKANGTKVSITKMIKVAKTGNSETYRILAVANAGADLTAKFDPYNNGTKNHIKPLVTFARYSDYDKTNAVAWTVAADGKKSNFIMSSEREAVVTITGSETPAQPATVTIPLERMAARIDFAEYNDSYTVTGGEDIVKPQALKLVNLLDAGSYLFKRVSTDGNTVSYLGDETDENYVIDPWTIAKTQANLGATTPFDFNGTPVNAFYLYHNYIENLEEMDPGFGLSALIHDSSTGKDYYILDYTLENTTTRENQVNGYSTGIMFQATYIPKKVTEYHYTARGGENFAANGKENETFLSSNNKTILSKDLRAVVFSSLGQTQPDKNDFFAFEFTTSNTYQDLQDYANRMVKDDEIGFKKYLEAQWEGKPSSDHLTGNVSWKAFIETTYGYNAADNTYSKEGAKALEEKGVNVYTAGKSYYPYWIRHVDNKTSDSGIMEFAIVRNNVYKLRILSFSGLGDPFPYRPGITPDEDSKIKMEVSVRAWTLRDHPLIIL